MAEGPVQLFDRNDDGSGEPRTTLLAAGMANWLATADHQHLLDVARKLFRCPTAAVIPKERGDGTDNVFACAVLGAERPLVVEDALADPRFRNCVLVRAYPHVRYFVGAGVAITGGLPVGTLAVMDYGARGGPSESELTALASLAALAGSHIEKQMLQLARPGQSAQFDFLVERARTGVLTVEFDGRIAAGNRAAQRLLRLPESRLVGARADDHVIGWRILVNDYRSSPPGGVERSLRTVLVELVTGDAGIVPALASLSFWIVEGVPAFRLVIEELG